MVVQLSGSVRHNDSRDGKGKRRNQLHEKVNTHFIHAKQLLVLLSKSILWFCEDLLTTAGQQSQRESTECITCIHI